MADNKEKISNLLASNKEAMKPNITELMRNTGLSRNSISKIFREVWANVKIRFVFTDEENKCAEALNLERAFIAIKLVANDIENITSFRSKLFAIDGVCEVLIIEGTEIDFLVKIVTPNSSTFSKLLFELKELDGVKNSDIAYRILRESPKGYSEYMID